MLRSLILFIVLLLGVSAVAQEYNYLQYTVADGMPSNTVYDIKQDNDGFIWMATDAGVTRFDGRKFVTFTQKDGLPSNDILILKCDKFNRVWMAPMHTSICYYYKGKIYNYKNDSTLSKLRFSTVILYMAETQNGDIVFQTNSIGNKGSSTILTHDNKIIKPKMPELNFSLCSVKRGIQSDEFQFAFYDTINSINSIFSYKINAPGLRHLITACWSKNNYITTYRIVKGKRELIDSMHYPDYQKMAIWKVVGNKLSFYENAPTSVRISSRLNQDEMAIFQSTHDGVYMNDSITGKITAYFAPGKICNRVFIDREKNIWIATHTDGVMMVPNQKISNISVNNPKDNILSLYKQNNTVFAGGTYGNLYTLQNNQSRQNNFDHYIQFANNQDQINKINWIEPATDGLILGTDDFILKYHTDNRKPAFCRTDVIKSMTTIGVDSLLVATGRCALLMNSKTLKVLDTIWPYRSYSVHKSGNSYYIGTPGGLLKVTPGLPMIPLQNIHPDLQALVNRIHKDPDGSFWMSTTGNGVIRLRNDSIIQKFNVANGLLSDNCKALFLDQKFVWVGTEKGLNRIDRLFPSAPVMQYTIEDGLASNDIHSIYSDSGKLYIGSSGKITVFDTSLIRRPSICNLMLLSMESGKRILSADSVQTLRHNENSLRFEFTGISFHSSRNITYYYRLKGFSDNWDSTLNTSLEFLALPPGDYQLEIFARNKFGVNSNIASVSFIIKPPFWNTWWFRILIGAILVAFVWWIVIRRIRLEQAKSVTQNRINELEQLALRSQMNPHFIFNCLNSIQNFLLQNNFEKTNEYLTSFAHLIRQTLDNSSRSSISIDTEARYLSSYLELESMRFGHSFMYDIEVDPAIDSGNTYMPTMILQPYVENSIRHGLRYRQDGVKNVNVFFRKRGNTLVCIVEDNGIGRKKASELKSFMHVEYQSKGMTLTAERIEALNRRQDIPITVDVIDLEDGGNATGTQVIVRFPNVFL